MAIIVLGHGGGFFRSHTEIFASYSPQAVLAGFAGLQVLIRYGTGTNHSMHVHAVFSDNLCNLKSVREIKAQMLLPQNRFQTYHPLHSLGLYIMTNLQTLSGFSMFTFKLHLSVQVCPPDCKPYTHPGVLAHFTSQQPCLEPRLAAHMQNSCKAWEEQSRVSRTLSGNVRCMSGCRCWGIGLVN